MAESNFRNALSPVHSKASYCIHASQQMLFIARLNIFILKLTMKTFSFNVGQVHYKVLARKCRSVARFNKKKYMHKQDMTVLVRTVLEGVGGLLSLSHSVGNLPKWISNLCDFFTSNINVLWQVLG